MLCVSNNVLQPMRADASAASVPAWPPPTTITSKCWGYSMVVDRNGTIQKVALALRLNDKWRFYRRPLKHDLPQAFRPAKRSLHRHNAGLQFHNTLTTGEHMSTGKILVAQGGGPTAVINQSLVGVALEARRFGQIGHIYGCLLYTSRCV